MADECARCVRWDKDKTSGICREKDSPFYCKRTESDTACDQITKGEPVGWDWMKEEIVVSYQRGYTLYIRRVKVLRETKRSIYVEYIDRQHHIEGGSTETIRLSKKHLEAHGHMFAVRWIRFRLFSNLQPDTQERFQGKQEITL